MLIPTNTETYVRTLDELEIPIGGEGASRVSLTTGWYEHPDGRSLKIREEQNSRGHFAVREQ